MKSASKKAKAGAAKVEKAAPKKSSSKKLAVGDNISSVGATLITEEEKEVTLSELTKEKGIVIFMYPRANTPGWSVKKKCLPRSIQKKGFYLLISSLFCTIFVIRLFHLFQSRFLKYVFSTLPKLSCHC